MKIALVSDWFHPRVGGIEHHLLDLARRLRAARHKVVVITPTPGEGDVNGIRVRRIAGRRAPVFDFLYSPAGIRALGTALEEEQPDAVHCHVSIVSPAAMGGAAIAQRVGVPAVVSFHSVVPQMRTLAYAAGALLGARRWNARYTAVSARVARDVQAFAGDAPVTILPNGIDSHFWRADSPPLPRSSRRLELVSVMRLNSKKRPFALIDIVRRAQVSMPIGRPLRLRIIGDGPLASRLADAVRRASLSNVIELLGYRTREEIRQIYGECDVFVLPTVRESFGIAALEACCAGVPVIAMSASGVADVIRHGHEGLLARSDEELASHVVTLARNPEQREAIAANNRTKVSPYDWSRVVKLHLDAYREAIALRESVRAEM